MRSPRTIAVSFILAASRSPIPIPPRRPKPFRETAIRSLVRISPALPEKDVYGRENNQQDYYD
jgi:hypothetical protein